jgi:hypothetical protein
MNGIVACAVHGGWRNRVGRKVSVAGYVGLTVTDFSSDGGSDQSLNAIQPVLGAKALFCQ